MRALIVEDSRAIRGILRRILQELNFEVLEAGNGREALEVLKQKGKADLALVDWNMPVMNGYEFVRMVRAESDYKEMRLIMVTTRNQIDDVATALQAGADEYVMKPFDKDMFVEKLALLGIAQP